MKRILFFFAVLVLVGAGCMNAAPEQESTEVVQNIYLEAPSEGSTVTSPMTIEGTARVFEGTVSWRILSTAEELLLEGFTTAEAADVGEYGPFTDRIFLPVIEDDSFILEVFTYSPMDGSQQDLVRRYLELADTGKISVNVYFVDPDAAEYGDCSSVDFEKRTVAHTVNVAELAVKELLQGPTAMWATTMIPEFTTLESVSIEDGIATVRFSSPDISMWSGGSCRVLAILAQINETLLQFDSVDSVKIYVNGESETILQP